jgi:predicted metal-dependent phosphoesterase TrpH
MPNTSIDLHLHTYYSDGRTSPAEMLHHAASIGLKVVAITDHDNLNSAQEASHVAKVLGLELVSGVELTAHWGECPPADGDPGDGQDVDILGYFFDPAHPALQEFTHQAMSDLRQRIEDACQVVSDAGYPMTIFDVLDENPRYPGAIQFINALRHKGYARRWSEAYPIFSTVWSQVRSCRATVEMAIQVLHRAGGVAMLAHPVAVACETGGLLKSQQLAKLVELGLDGLEIHHPRLDAEARLHFYALARQFNLAVSGGSDEHGWKDGFTRMGSELITYEMVNSLRERAKLYINRQIR